MRLVFICFLLSLCCSLVHSEEPPSLFPEGVTVDLREPLFKDGVLSTEKGGVITAPGMRIQARRISYTRTDSGALILAEDDLMVEMGEVVFVGDRLEYNFITNQGSIFNGRASVHPWFFGGSQIDLLPDGSYYIWDAFVTTSENLNPEWQIYADNATISENRVLNARNIQLRYRSLPLFWLPRFKANLYSLAESPIRYNFKWGGHQGPRAGIVYEVISLDRFKAFLRFDYRLTRGPGGGFETYYQSEDHREELETINYVAKDSSVEHPHESVRYRFQGLYHNLFWDDTTTLDLSWDKISDKQMPTDYDDRGLELDTAGRTQLLLRQQQDFWIGSFLTRVRVNPFQTVNQELPTLASSWHPFVLGESGIITDNSCKASYLDFTYGNDMRNVKDYNSGRVEFQTRLYRPFYFDFLTFTPEAGAMSVLYNNSPQKESRYLLIGKFGGELQTQLYHYYPTIKHVIEPYARYEYFTYPTVNPDDHYIFSIDDGWYRLNRLKVGCRQLFYHKSACGEVHKMLGADLWTNLFFDTKTLTTCPKAYASFVFNSFESLRHTISTAWDFQHGELDHFNFRTQWTYDDNLAVAAEYRHRDAFAWRKVEYDNFILDSFRSINHLEHSQLSDKRDTLLVHLFYRFHPRWALEFESRFGWLRRHEPAYKEYEIDLLNTLPSGWKFKMSYQHKEDEDRVAFYINLDLGRPKPEDSSCSIPFLDF